MIMTSEEVLGQVHSNRESAVIALGYLRVIPGQVYVVKYSLADGGQSELVAVGIKDGMGPDCYTIVSAEPLGIISAVLDSVPDVSQTIFGGIYLIRGGERIKKCYKLSDGSLHVEELTDPFYFNLLEDDKYYLAFQNQILKVTDISSGIQEVARAISSCGIETTENETFSSLVEKISNLEVSFWSKFGYTKDFVDGEVTSYFDGVSAMMESWNPSDASNWKSTYPGGVEELVFAPFVDMSGADDLHELFKGCLRLRVVPVYNTSKVTNMAGMFSNCPKLTSVPVLNTSKVTNMNGMFMDTGLTTIPELDTSKVTDMSNMFYGSALLTEIPKLDTSRVTNMSHMFTSCGNLTTIPELDTSKVTDMTSMFSMCGNLTTIPKLNTSKVTVMADMFSNCGNLTTIPELDVSGVTVFGGDSAFYGCSSLVTCNLKNLGASVSFRSSNQLSRESVIYMISNSSDASPITITLSTTTYGQYMGHPEVMAALSENPNVSISM